MALAQGDLTLLEGDLAKRLLASRTLARLAYSWTDGTPRVVPIWFHWTGTDLVFGTFTTSPKVAALRERPAIAVTIDTEGEQNDVLLVRGEASITTVDGVVPEYALAAARYLGEEGAAGFLAQLPAGAPMARIAVRPTWAAVIDFQTRFPSAMGGVMG